MEGNKLERVCMATLLSDMGCLLFLLVVIKDGSAVLYVGTVRYASISAKKYCTLLRYALFVMVRLRYVGTVRFKN